MKGYKIFNPDFTCKDVQYKEGETFEVALPIKICEKGIHFCIKASHCFTYYSFDPSNIVCEVEALGEVQTDYEDSKVCTNKLKVIRRLIWEEVLVLANEGKNNSGHSNSGDRNSGDRNSGSWNSGNSNSGSSNSGYRNSGYRNSGYSNSGNSNSGDRNSGYRNSGDSNSGDSNSGDRNSGSWNSGNRNSGYRNSGSWNSGSWNSGSWNSGDSNSGDSNSGYRNPGAFCVDENPVVWLFDNPTKIKVKDWENSNVIRTLNELLELTTWVPDYEMTNEEKQTNSKWQSTEGYLKTKTLHEAWADMWGNLDEKRKKYFLDMPNFDAKKFKTITGINV